jgi:hypothetical protein
MILAPEWLARAVFGLRLARIPELRVRLSADDPSESNIPRHILVIEVRDGHKKWAHFSCPKCGERISLPVATNSEWSIRVDFLRRPTIVPSVWQTGSCSAHFFVRGGAIEWVGASRPAD